MKKSLVLAMALAMGVTASAYAANPFSDVPAGHWAYDSIQQLADAGVIEGYGDTTFGGDRLMTRYEMAQIVAKAMARGANVDKLAAEFADELDTLGVRVANLEKKADNVRVTGQIRYEYNYNAGGKYKKKFNGGDSVYLHRLRSRIYINGKINDTWNYTGRIQNDQKLNNDDGDETTKFNQAYISGRLGGLRVLAGKADLFRAEGFLYDDTAEFVQITYGKDVKFDAYYGQPTDYDFGDMWGVSVSGKIGSFNVSVGYDEMKDADGSDSRYYSTFCEDGEDNGVFNATVKYDFGGEGTLGFTYLHSDVDDSNDYFDDVDTDGYVVFATYKGANRNKPNTWGLWANYYNQGAGTTLAHTMKPGQWADFQAEGFEGYAVGASYTIAKNMVYMLEYFDIEGKESDIDDQLIFSRLQITF